MVREFYPNLKLVNLKNQVTNVRVKTINFELEVINRVYRLPNPDPF